MLFLLFFLCDNICISKKSSNFAHGFQIWTRDIHIHEDLMFN